MGSSRQRWIFIALLLSIGPVEDRAVAAPGETQNLRFDSNQTLAWDTLAGSAGYHVYRSDTASLPDHGVCLFGSVQGTSVAVTDDPPAGVAWTFLAAAFDETGQGTLGTDSSGNGRVEGTPCVPARRFFPLTVNGDGGDGVIDGLEPRRNASAGVWGSRREATGVYLHSGEFFLAATDLSIPSRGMNTRVARAYRSQIDYDGPLGHGWDSNWNARLDPLGTDVLFHDGSGRREVFERSGGSAFFDSPAGLYAVLRENPDSSFDLRAPDGTILHFHSLTDGSNREGALESIEDRNGNTVALLYDHQGLLVTIVDTLGRTLDFTYDPSGRLTDVIDFAGRSCQYGYNPEGELITARSPIVTGTPNGNDFPAGKTTTYAYSVSANPRLEHNLVSVVFPNQFGSGTPGIQVTYESAAASFEFDRVVSQTIGGTNAGGVPAGGTLGYAYVSLNPGAPHDLVTPRRQASVTDRNGNVSMHIHNVFGNRLTVEEQTNRNLRPGEGDYTTAYTYNSDGEVTATDLPEGNRIEITYDSPGADRYREGNVLQRRWIADAGRGDGHGNGLNDVVSSYSHEPIYNRIATTVDPRGNDPSYVPQNGGAQSAARYTTRWTYDYEEGDPATNGIDAYAIDWGIDTTGARSVLGDQNQDARTDQAAGNTVKTEFPTVDLSMSPNQQALEGDGSQEVVGLLQWNDFGQLVGELDPEGNTHSWAFHPENDPDGDGVPTPAPPDGRTLDGTTGGYPKTGETDTTSGIDRNNKTDPTPAGIREDFRYDEVGNLTHYTDGRGVLTRRIFNELNQVMELRRAAATADASGPDGDPATGRGETGLAAPGFKVRYEYDANDNRTRVELEDRDQYRGVGPWVERHAEYDMLDNPVRADIETTATTTLETLYRYDPNENPVLTILPEGNASSAEFDERDLPLRSTRGATSPPPLAQLGPADPMSYDVRGGTAAATSLDYDGNRNPTTLTDGRNNPWTFAYDGLDRLAVAIDPEDDRAARCYDPSSNVVRAVTRGPGSAAEPSPCTSTSTFDLRHVEVLYDELNRGFRVDRRLFVPVEPARTAVIAEGTLVPGDGFVNTRFEYDRLSRLTFVTADSEAAVRHDWDGASRRLESFLPDGTIPNTSRTRYTWDAGDNLVETLETEKSSSAGPADEEFFTTFAYDALGRLTRGVDNVGQTARLAYDSLDTVIQASDPRGPMSGSINRRTPGRTGESVAINSHGNVSNFTSDGAGRLTTVERVLTVSGEGDGTLGPTVDTSNVFNADGLITLTTVWDLNSLPTSRVDDRGNTTSYAYDNLDRLVTITPDDGTTVQVLYDANHNVTQIADANGSVLAHTYDLADRRTQTDVTRASGVVGTTQQTFAYDGLSRLVRATDNNDPADDEDDVTTDFFYDSLNRLVEERQQIGTLAAGAAANTDYQWSAANLLTRLVYPDGREIDYTYDSADRLTSIGDADALRPESASFEYFGMDRPHTITRNNGVTTTMLDGGGSDVGYDGLRRIVELRHLDSTDGDLATFEYGYDRANNRIRERRRHHAIGPDLKGELYAYDSANRLISFFEGAVDGSGAANGSSEDTQDWTLDGMSNWRELVRNGTTYGATANNLNEYDEDQSGGNRTDDGILDDFRDDLGTAMADGRNQAHDKNGNVTLTDDGTVDDTLEYDALNRLARATRDAATIGSYIYDALGRRARRIVTNRGTLNEHVRYLYGGGRVVEERDDVGATDRQRVAECVVQIVEIADEQPAPGYSECGGFRATWQLRGAGTSAEHLLADGAGSTVAVTPGTSDSVVERVTYDAFGTPTVENANNEKLCDDSNPQVCGAGGAPYVSTSQFGNPNLSRGRRYDPELAVRTDSPNTDWSGSYLARTTRLPSSAADEHGRYTNPNLGRHIAPEGTLHAYDAITGEEQWTNIPPSLTPNMTLSNLLGVIMEDIDFIDGFERGDVEERFQQALGRTYPAYSNAAGPDRNYLGVSVPPLPLLPDECVDDRDCPGESYGYRRRQPDWDSEARKHMGAVKGYRELEFASATDLDPGGARAPHGLIDEAMATGVKQGYDFSVVPYTIAGAGPADHATVRRDVMRRLVGLVLPILSPLVPNLEASGPLLPFRGFGGMTGAVEVRVTTDALRLLRRRRP